MHVHTNKMAMNAANECRFELFPYPSYLSDLTPSDFYLFYDLEKFMHGQQFDSSDNVTEVAEL